MAESKNTRMAHIVNLMSIAGIDGNISDEEKTVIFKITQDLGLTEEDFEICIEAWKAVDESQLETAVPESDEEKYNYLKNMVLVMMVDGEIEDNERQYIMGLAEKFGFDGEEAVSHLIDEVYNEYFADDEDEEEEEDDDEDEEELDEDIVDDARIDTRLFRFTEEQLENINELANHGNGEAQYVLGRYHQVAKPSDDSVDIALECYKEAIKHGVADAYAALAQMTMLGYTDAVDIEEYDNLVAKGIEEGSSIALMMKMEDMIYGNNGYKTDPKKVIKFLEDEILSDEEDAFKYPYFYAVLGDAYNKTGNKAKAADAYEQASFADYKEVAYKKSSTHLEGLNSMAKEMYEAVIDMECDDDLPGCFTLRAMLLGEAYEKQDAKQRKATAKKIVEALEHDYEIGFDKAATKLADIYYLGEYGIARDVEKAWQWYYRGSEREDAAAFAGLATMVKDGLCPQDPPESFLEWCQISALRRGDKSQLKAVVKAYRAGKLDMFAEEIENIYIPMLEGAGEDYSDMHFLAIVKPDGNAMAYRFIKDDWSKVAGYIGAKRLAPVRVDALDAIGKKLGISEHITAWIDIEAPRKKMPLNIAAKKFYKGVIAGDIVLTLADDIWDPMLFMGVDDLKNLIEALGGNLVKVITDELALSKEKREYTKISSNLLHSESGFVARIQPDNTAHLVDSNHKMFALVEEDIYDPIRLESLYKTGEKLGLKGRLTLWIDNSALRRQKIMNVNEMNAIGTKHCGGQVADNFFVAMEDENYNIMLFDDVEQLKKVVVALGVKPDKIIMD